MKRILLVLGLVVVGAFGALAIVAARFEAKIRPDTKLGPLDVGALSKEQAASRLDDWWREQQDKQVNLVIPGAAKSSATVALKDLGYAPDEEASVGQLQVSDFWDSAKHAVGAGAKAQAAQIVFKKVSPPTPSLRRFLVEAMPRPSHAKAYWKEGKITTIPETPAVVLDQDKLDEAIEKAIADDSAKLEVPLKEAQKSIPDESLAQIKEVVSSFTTHFPAAKKDRNTNIRIASGKINGIVLAPGQQFSFNKVVGKRTIEDGFKQAPVFKNGKHDMGVGGGICQVSSTLYNASLFANLKIVERHNHSLPVAYLPPGRDATVDYNGPNFVIENNQSTPIAINAEYQPGALTFRILGQRDPNLKVEIESSGLEVSDLETQTVQDPKLAAGEKKVLEKGSRGKSIRTYRVVYKNGAVVERQPLGRSVYKGTPRVIAVGTKPKAAPAPLVPAVVPPVPPPVTP